MNIKIIIIVILLLIAFYLYNKKKKENADSTSSDTTSTEIIPYSPLGRLYESAGVAPYYNTDCGLGLRINDPSLKPEKLLFYKTPGLLIFDKVRYSRDKTKLLAVKNNNEFSNFLQENTYNVSMGYTSRIFLPGVYNTKLNKDLGVDAKVVGNDTYNFTYIWRNYISFIVFPGYDVLFAQFTREYGDLRKIYNKRNIETDIYGEYNLRIQNNTTKPILFEYSWNTQRKWDIINTEYTVNSNTLIKKATFSKNTGTWSEKTNLTWDTDYKSINWSNLSNIAYYNADNTLKITFRGNFVELLDNPEGGAFECMLVRVIDEDNRII